MTNLWKILIFTAIFFVYGFGLPLTRSQKISSDDDADNNVQPFKESFQLNNQFRDIRLTAYKNFQPIKNAVTFIEEYKNQHPNSNLSELNLPMNLDALKEFLSSIDIYDPKNDYAFIRPETSQRFISGQDGRGPMELLTTHPEVPLGWEVFAFEKHENGSKVALKSRGKYVSSENGKSAMKCNRQSVGKTELFEMIDYGNEVYSFKCNNGKYVSSDPAESNYLFCNSDSITENEKFNLVFIGDLSDEINISWNYYDSFFSDLFGEHDVYVSTKNVVKKAYVQQIIDNCDYKSLMKQLNTQICHIENLVDKEIQFLNGILWTEVSRAEKIDRMLEKLASAKLNITE